MKSPRVFLVAALVFLGGCAGGPNYYGGTSYSIPNMGACPCLARSVCRCRRLA